MLLAFMRWTLGEPLEKAWHPATWHAVSDAAEATGAEDREALRSCFV